MPKYIYKFIDSSPMESRKKLWRYRFINYIIAVWTFHFPRGRLIYKRAMRGNINVRNFEYFLLDFRNVISHSLDYSSASQKPTKVGVLKCCNDFLICFDLKEVNVILIYYRFFFIVLKFSHRPFIKVKINEVFHDDELGIFGNIRPFCIYISIVYLVYAPETTNNYLLLRLQDEVFRSWLILKKLGWNFQELFYSVTKNNDKKYLKLHSKNKCVVKCVIFTLNNYFTK